MTGDVPAPGDASHLHEWLARQYPSRWRDAWHDFGDASHQGAAGFGQTIRPCRVRFGLDVARLLDPDPDYFFHWLRDSAIVIDALRHVIVEGRAAEGSLVQGVCRVQPLLNRSMVACFYAIMIQKNMDPCSCIRA